MSRIMCFDYGTKRVGIAVTDSLQLIATALCTVHPNEIETFMDNYLKTEEVSEFVVGLPKHADGSLNEVERYIKGFVKRLNTKFPHIPVLRIDERYTSKIAQQSLLMSGLKKKDRKNKALVDQTSAVIMLQNYMKANKNI